MKTMIRVLFLCVHNSARSQMGEAYLRRYGGALFATESAGLEPGVLNPLAVQAMALDGMDISHNVPKSVFDLHAQGKDYDWVIQVCDASRGQACPVFPGAKKILHWDLEDPSAFVGTWEERLEKTIAVRDRIRALVQGLVKDTSSPDSPADGGQSAISNS